MRADEPPPDLYYPYEELLRLTLFAANKPVPMRTVISHSWLIITRISTETITGDQRLLGRLVKIIFQLNNRML